MVDEGPSWADLNDVRRELAASIAEVARGLDTRMVTMDLQVRDIASHVDKVDSEGSRAFKAYRRGLASDKTALRTTAIGAVSAVASLLSVLFATGVLH